MHENLKYTLKLDKKIKPFEKFEGKDPLNKDDRAEISDWQAIYADNKYGTHYFLYAKFIGAKKVVAVKDSTDTSEKADEFIVEKIQLYVQNYSGQVSLGIIEHASIEEMTIEANDPDQDLRFPDRKKYYLQVGLQGFNMTKSSYSFKPKTPLILKDGDIIMTDPVFVPVNPVLSKIFDPENINKSDFVDELFMGRLGSDVFVTDEGKNKIKELFLLGKGLVDEDNLIKVGIDVDTLSSNDSTSADWNNQRAVEVLGRPYPCIPIYSVCEIK